MEEFEKEVDAIINQSLKDYKAELAIQNFDGWNESSIVSRLDALYSTHYNRHVEYINSKFPLSPSTKHPNNYVRLRLYAYAANRTKEFDTLFNGSMKDFLGKE